MTRLSSVRPASAEDSFDYNDPTLFEGPAAVPHSALTVRAGNASGRLQPDATSQSGGAGIGAISIFALIVILCLAVLAVLTVATAHSSLVLAQRQAQATQQIYLNEVAAQTFVAGIDAIVSDANDDSLAMDLIDESLVDLCASAQDATEGAVTAYANTNGQDVRAEFTCGDGRTLRVVLSVDDGSYEITSWRTIAIVNEEQPMGTLYLGE